MGWDLLSVGPGVVPGMNSETQNQAKAIAARLDARSAQFCRNEISYEVLSEGNRKDWAEAQSNPELKEEVLRLLRDYSRLG